MKRKDAKTQRKRERSNVDSKIAVGFATDKYSFTCRKHMSPEMVVALLAVIFAFYQAYISRQHNRMSVMPSIGTKISWDRMKDGIVLTYSLVNFGLGPARVKRMDLLFQRQKFPANEHDPVEAILRKACDGKLDIYIEKTALPHPGYCINAQEEYLLFRAFFPKLIKGEEHRIKTVLEELDFNFVYESFYGKQMELNSVEEKVEERK